LLSHQDRSRHTNCTQLRLLTCWTGRGAEHIIDPKDKPSDAGPSAAGQATDAAAGTAGAPEQQARGSAASAGQQPLQVPAVAAPSPAFLRMMAAAHLQRQQQQSQAQPLAEPLTGQVPGAEPLPSWPPASTRVPSDPGAQDVTGTVPPWPPAGTRVLSDPSQMNARLDAPRTSPTISHRRAGSSGAAVTRHGGDHIGKPGRHPAAALARSPAVAAQLIADAQGAQASDPPARQQQQWPWQSSAQPPSAVYSSEASYQPAMLLPDPPARMGLYGDPIAAHGMRREQQPGQSTFIPLAGTGPYLLGQLGSEQAGFRCARVSRE